LDNVQGEPRAKPSSEPSSGLPLVSSSFADVRALLESAKAPPPDAPPPARSPAPASVSTTPTLARKTASPPMLQHHPTLHHHGSSCADAYTAAVQSNDRLSGLFGPAEPNSPTRQRRSAHGQSVAPDPPPMGPMPSMVSTMQAAPQHYAGAAANIVPSLDDILLGAAPYAPPAAPPTDELLAGLQEYLGYAREARQRPASAGRASQRSSSTAGDLSLTQRSSGPAGPRPGSASSRATSRGTRAEGAPLPGDVIRPGDVRSSRPSTARSARSSVAASDASRTAKGDSSREKMLSSVYGAAAPRRKAGAPRSAWSDSTRVSASADPVDRYLPSRAEVASFDSRTDAHSAVELAKSKLGASFTAGMAVAARNPDAARDLAAIFGNDDPSRGESLAPSSSEAVQDLASILNGAAPAPARPHSAVAHADSAHDLAAILTGGAPAPAPAWNENTAGVSLLDSLASRAANPMAPPSPAKTVSSIGASSLGASARGSSARRTTGSP